MKSRHLITLLLPVCFLLLLVACQKEKPSTKLDGLDISSDSLRQDSVEDVMEEMPMPKVADELFDDFIFNFAASRKLQMQRIAFPLEYETGGETKKLAKADWKMDYLFMQEEFYTLLLDNEKQQQVVGDTTVKSVVIEKIQLPQKHIKKYIFERTAGRWMLKKIHEEPLAANANGDFLDFYDHFSTDTLYQSQSMADNVTFTAPDPDDELNNMTGTMMPEQWADFKPEVIPSGTIYNIDYGNTSHSDQQKTMLVRGIANGLETTLTFGKKGGHWKLTQFTY